MNWTGSKRNNFKLKTEKEKQREFFNRQLSKNNLISGKQNNNHNMMVIINESKDEDEDEDKNYLDHKITTKSLPSSILFDLEHSKANIFINDHKINSAFDLITKEKSATDTSLQQKNIDSDIENQKSESSDAHDLFENRNISDNGLHKKNKPEKKKVLYEESEPSPHSSSREFTNINSISSVRNFATTLIAPSISSDSLKWHDFLRSKSDDVNDDNLTKIENNSISHKSTTSDIIQQQDDNSGTLLYSLKTISTATLNSKLNSISNNDSNNLPINQATKISTRDIITNSCHEKDYTSTLSIPLPTITTTLLLPPLELLAKNANFSPIKTNSIDDGYCNYSDGDNETEFVDSPTLKYSRVKNSINSEDNSIAMMNVLGEF
nr:2071_t:CDS:2 [Entrophospora candida]